MDLDQVEYNFFLVFFYLSINCDNFFLLNFPIFKTFFLIAHYSSFLPSYINGKGMQEKIKEYKSQEKNAGSKKL